MQFADGQCFSCGAEFGDKKPTKITKVEEPYTAPFKRVVEYVAPCPSCGKDVPLWAGADALPEPPTEPEAETEPANP